MQYIAKPTEEFCERLAQLQLRGGTGKVMWNKAMRALSEWQLAGKITLATTHHGESRLPNVTKYDLGDGYRMVVQRPAKERGVLVFRFIGDHEDSQRWLDRHRDDVYLQTPHDRLLAIVQETMSPIPAPACPVSGIPQSDLRPTGPLLQVEADFIKGLPFPDALTEYLLKVTAAEFEQNEDGIFELLDKDYESGSKAYDLLIHAYRQEWPELHKIGEQILGLANKVEGAVLADAILDPVNSEQFVDFDDLRDLPEVRKWDEWLVFLSAKQKELARAAHEGAARLRGVSGSGKTCVLLHRAKHLVNEYDSKVLVVTSTESMRAQLDRLLDQLCQPMVRGEIITRTVVGLARDIVTQATGSVPSSITELGREALLSEIVQFVRELPEFGSSGLKAYDAAGLHTFMGDELDYLRSRVRRSDFRPYYKFERRGRGRGLSKSGRQVCIAAANKWEDRLRERELWDEFSLVQFALELIEDDKSDQNQRQQHDNPTSGLHGNGSSVAKAICSFGSILVDEVQDLTQLEISLLGALPSGDGAKVGQKRDGLYLVGDSAQAIYKKGFSLRACGIELPGARSFFLKRNYRNTREVLEAAFAVIETFPYVDFGEETSAPPASPEYALQHGPRPAIVACASLEEEAIFIADKIENLHLSAASSSANGNRAEERLPIGIIAADPNVRGVIVDELQRRQWSSGSCLSIASTGGHRRCFVTWNHAKDMSSTRCSSREFRTARFPGPMRLKTICRKRRQGFMLL